MKVTVDQNKCIGCGACQAMCPDVFEFNDDGIMDVTNSIISEDNKEDVMDAEESCPVSAIEVEQKN